MSFLEIQIFKKIIARKKNLQKLNLTKENLPKKIIRRNQTGNLEKIVRIHFADKTIA